MNRKQAKKAAPIKLAWQDQIIAAEWPEKPARATIYAVAMMLASFADRDGSGACPAVGTIASALRVKRQTVCDVLAMMVDADHLTKTGRTAYGTTIYSLRLKRHTETTLAVPHAVSPRGTQLPTLDRKGEGGGDSSPGTDTPTAVVAGTNTDDIKTIKRAATLGDQHADLTVASFVTDFDATFAKRERSSTVAAQRLEPTHSKLRTEIVAKIDAGWPQDHLIDRLIASLPADDRKISTLTGLVANKLSRLPNAPDYTARQIINDRNIATEATRKLDAARAQHELDTKSKRREEAITRYRKALKRYGKVTDLETLDAEVASMVQSLDDEAQYDDDPAAWPLSATWIEFIDTETELVRKGTSEKLER